MTSQHEIDHESSINVSEFEYPEDVLRFLRLLLDDFAIACFRKVAKQSVKDGLHKTKLEDYQKLRKRYDAAFTKLEAQGLIVEDKNFRIKNGRPYVLTIRGIQFFHLFKNEIKSINGGV